MNDQTEKITDLRDVVGDALRLVLRNRRQSWTVIHSRNETPEWTAGAIQSEEDATDPLTTERREDIVRDLVFEELAWPAQADRYNLGEPQATVRFFEDGLAIILATDDASGYLVVIDGDVDASVREIVDACRRTFC